jgi:hypothetical protein
MKNSANGNPITAAARRRSIETSANGEMFPDDNAWIVRDNDPHDTFF